MDYQSRASLDLCSTGLALSPGSGLGLFQLYGHRNKVGTGLKYTGTGIIRALRFASGSGLANLGSWAHNLLPYNVKN